jgi:2'-deoxynucleoside 5'-phosphate N-hydrolase
MKIYFAGSIRGGREDALLYARFIRFLKQYGTVLTEHIGDPSLTVSGDKGISDRNIHDCDLAWLKEADLVVAEVTIASLGVGYEIGKATEFRKKTICLYRDQPGKKLSAMIAGCPAITLIHYHTPEEAESGIAAILNNSESFQN